MRTTITISDENHVYLSKLVEQNGLGTISNAVEKMITEHRTSDETISLLQENLVEKIYERFAKDLTRIRLGSNTADRNSQIIKEQVNKLLIVDESKFPSSYADIKSSDVEKAKTTKAAEKFINDNIKAYKIHQANSVNSKQEGSSKILPEVITDKKQKTTDDDHLYDSLSAQDFGFYGTEGVD